MHYPNTTPLDGPRETPQDKVEIRQDEAITVQDALHIAAVEQFPIGKSTLQRWAKVWYERGAAAPVKCVLVTNRFGNSYKLHRSEFEAWVLDQKENMKSQETFADPARSHEAQTDAARPHQTSQDPDRSEEASPGETYRQEQERGQSEEERERLRELEEENLQLKIDLGARKQIISQVREELQSLRENANELLRENGALEFQLRQLQAPEESPKRLNVKSEQEDARDTYPETDPFQTYQNRGVDNDEIEDPPRYTV